VPTETYITREELAKLMGISKSTIQRMVQEGMPSETWGMGNTRRFRASEAMAWARERATISKTAQGN